MGAGGSRGSVGSPCPALVLPQRPGGREVGVELPEAPMAEGQCSLAAGPVSSTQASQGGARARGFRQGMTGRKEWVQGLKQHHGRTCPGTQGAHRVRPILRHACAQTRDHGGPTPSCFQGDHIGSSVLILPRSPFPHLHEAHSSVSRGARLSRKQPPRTWGHCPQACQGTGFLLAVCLLFSCIYVHLLLSR